MTADEEDRPPKVKLYGSEFVSAKFLPLEDRMNILAIGQRKGLEERFRGEKRSAREFVLTERRVVVISPEGYFCVAIMSANRRRFSSQDMKGGGVEERANAADSYLSYSGPCEIEKDKFRVKVEVSLFPNWIGGIQERNYKIEGKTLSVWTTPTLVNGKEQVGYLIFERV